MIGEGETIAASGAGEASADEAALQALTDDLAREVALARERYDRPVTALRVARWYRFLKEHSLGSFVQTYMDAAAPAIRRIESADEQRQSEDVRVRVEVDWAALQAAMEREEMLVEMIEIVCDTDEAGAREISMRELSIALRFFLPACTVPIQGLLGIAPALSAATIEATALPQPARNGSDS